MRAVRNGSPTIAMPVLKKFNSERHGHVLIDLIRVRGSAEPATEAHQLLSKAINDATQSTGTGFFGEASGFIRAAASTLPEPIASQLDTLRHRLGTDVPILCSGDELDRVGTQVLAGMICAKLLSNATSTINRLPGATTSMCDREATLLTDTLIFRLTECESKSEVRQHLVDFMRTVTTETAQLPAGQRSIIDVVAGAIDECDAFDVTRAGHRLRKPLSIPDHLDVKEVANREITDERWWHPTCAIEPALTGVGTGPASLR